MPFQDKTSIKILEVDSDEVRVECSKLRMNGVRFEV